ncbi:MAG: phospholipid carrier-dependent glycosyltransferase, partial [bacterium]|nr:phospholipid carrier-dependent glycosyltransferase [bacterium]
MVHAWCALGFLFFCRLVANYFIPLNDTTEARYGEIARKMIETGNWVTLQHDYGIPFWAKPPLSTWLTALSMQLFGVNEFAARLPALLLSLGMLWLIWDIAKKQGDRFAALMTILILASTLFFFLDAGTVMTDPALIFCTTLCFVAFWHALTDGHKLWSYLFFIGLGLGLLAKGPIALVLVGLPLFFWVVFNNKWKALWQKLPWFSGIGLLVLIALPWYVLAELRTPGFLNYFIIGEHINRFLTPGWSGDKYGIAHYAPKGMIWVFALIGFFPWNLVSGIWLVRYFNQFKLSASIDNGWLSYLFLWV